MHRVMGCPGYLAAKQRWPRRMDEESPEATTGNRIHEAMTYVIDGEEVEMNQTQREIYLTEQMNEMRQTLTIQLLGGGEPDYRAVEKRLWMKHNNVTIATAKPDLIEAKNKQWLIIDYKSGTDEVTEAAANWQLATAATCIQAEEELTHKYGMDAVYGAIIQPLVSRRPVVVKMTTDEVFALRTQIFRELNVRTSTKILPRRAGVHCKYCPVGHVCIEGQAIGALVAKDKRFSELDKLSGKQLAELWKMLPMIDKKVEEVRAYIKQMIANFPDCDLARILTIKEVGSGQDIKDNIPFLRDLVATEMVTKGEFWAMATVKVSQIRDLFVKRWSEKNSVTKKDALVVWENMFSAHLEDRPKKKLIERIQDGATKEIPEQAK